MVKQFNPFESIKMLGILLEPTGNKIYTGSFDRELVGITENPLKPQYGQRL